MLVSAGVSFLSWFCLVWVWVWVWFGWVGWPIWATKWRKWGSLGGCFGVFDKLNALICSNICKLNGLAGDELSVWPSGLDLICLMPCLRFVPCAVDQVDAILSLSESVRLGRTLLDSTLSE